MQGTDLDPGNMTAYFYNSLGLENTFYPQLDLKLKSSSKLCCDNQKRKKKSKKKTRQKIQYSNNHRCTWTVKGAVTQTQMLNLSAVFKILHCKIIEFVSTGKLWLHNYNLINIWNAKFATIS